MKPNLRPLLSFAFIGALLLPWNAHAQGNPLAADPFDGAFSDGSVTLRLERDGTGYEGVIEFNGQTFPANAQRQTGTLHGSFESDGQRYDFVAVRKGASLQFETGGTTYNLTAQTAASKAASNPLARASPSPPPATAAAPAPAGARFTNAVAGYSIAVPSGWQPQEDGSGDIVLVPPGGSFDPSGQNSEVYLLIHMADLQSPSQPEARDQIQEAFIAPQSMAAAVYKAAADGAVAIHDWRFQHPETTQPMRLKAYLIGGQGSVFALLGTGTPNLVDSRDKDLRGIAASLKLGQANMGASTAAGQPPPGQAQQGGMPPTAAGAPRPANGGSPDGIQRHPLAPATPGQLSDNNPQSLEWLNHLRGKLLSRLSSYTSGTAGGYSSNERMLLYPDGRFEYYSASNISVQADGPAYSASGSSGGQGTRRGTWRIVTGQGTSFLALVYEGSMQEEYSELDYRENKTFLDGSRVFVTVPQ